jgi:uncharacterized protein YndB with AHSA1/START domain
MKDFKKYYIITEEPEIVYQALTNAATIKLWTGEEAEMSTEPGSEFSLWEGSIVGKNIEFEQGKKLFNNGILMVKKKLQLLPLSYMHMKMERL